MRNDEDVGNFVLNGVKIFNFNFKKFKNVKKLKTVLKVKTQFLTPPFIEKEKRH
jgi:hypothetical protein